MGLFFKEKTPDKYVPRKEYIPPPSITSTIPSDGSFSGHFDKVMEDENQPGPDYYEYSKALKSVENQPLAEGQKYTITFAGFAAQGKTATDLVRSANVYLQSFDKEKGAFGQKMVQAKKEGITDLQTQVTTLQKENEQLSAKMTANNQKMIDLNRQILDNTQKLQTKEVSFNAEYESAKARVTEHITKITTYLNGTT